MLWPVALMGGFMSDRSDLVQSCSLPFYFCPRIKNAPGISADGVPSKSYDTQKNQKLKFTQALDLLKNEIRPLRNSVLLRGDSLASSFSAAGAAANHLYI
jgi:hypothetical protein